MKSSSLLFLLLATFLIVANHAATREFNINGWSGIVSAFGKIKGENSQDESQISSKAEQKIKGIIEKYLGDKKKPQIAQQNQQRQQQLPQQTDEFDNQHQQQAQQPNIDSSVLLSSINWNDHKETRDLINQKVPGGTSAVDALVKLLKENDEKA
jgi:hypothetical protein